MADEQTPAGPEGAVSLRVVRGGSSWRAHVPSALIYGVVFLAGQWGGCSKLDEQGRKLDDLRDRVAGIEGAMGLRRAVAHVSGAEGTGGTGAVSSD